MTIGTGADPAVNEPDEVAALTYRIAQDIRLTRFCDERGVDVQAVMDGEVEVDLSPICDDRGQIVPEPIDLRSARRS